MSFPSYRDFIIAHGYSPADPNVIDRGGDSIWRISSKNNLCRFSDDDNVRVTVCRSRHNQIGYMWNIGNDSGWVGPFDCFDDAMDHADMNVFD